MSWPPSKGYCVLDRPHIATLKSSQTTEEHRLLQICNPLGTDILHILQPFQIFSSFALRGVPELPRQCRAQLLLAPRLLRFPPVSSCYHRFVHRGVCGALWWPIRVSWAARCTSVARYSLLPCLIGQQQAQPQWRRWDRHSLVPSLR